jgi:hypothetical protein
MVPLYSDLRYMLMLSKIQLQIHRQAYSDVAKRAGALKLKV